MSEAVVDRVPLSELRPDPENVAVHGPHNRAALLAAVRRWGQLVPLVVDDDNVVRKGNLTYEVLRELGYSEANVVRGSFAGADDAVAFAVADNALGRLHRLDREALRGALRLMAEAEGLDPLAVGFTRAEFASLAADAAALLEGSSSPPLLAATPAQERLRLIQLFYVEPEHLQVMGAIEKLRSAWSLPTAAAVVARAAAVAVGRL